MAEPYTSPHRGNSGRSPFFWVVLASGCVAVGFYLFGAVALGKYGTLTKDFGWNVASSPAGYVVNDVDENGPAAGKLNVGDRVLAVGYDSRLYTLPLEANLQIIQPESSYTAVVERGGEEVRLELRTRVKKSYKGLARSIALFGVSLAFFVMGLLFGLLKPDERVPRLGWAACSVTGMALLADSLEPFRVYFSDAERIAGFLIVAPAPLQFAFAYHFYSRVPDGVPDGKPWAVLRRFLYACCALLLVPHWIIAWNQFTIDRTLAFYFAHTAFLTVFSLTTQFVVVSSLVAMCAVLIRNYLLVEEGSQRRRVKWIVYGTAAAIGPNVALTVFALGAYSGGYERLLLGTMFFALSQTVELLLVLIPLSLGYAVLKHRVFDINVVARRGMQYLLARGVLQVLLSLPVIGLAYSILGNPSLTVGEILSQNSVYLYLLIAAALSFKFRARLRDWLDRKFFRDAYDRERVLLRLVDDIKKHDSIEEISRRVSIELHYAMHPSRTLVAYRQAESSELTLTFSSGQLQHGFRILESSALLRALEGTTGARDVPLEGIDLSLEEREMLEANKIELIVPITGAEGRLVGLLLLGGKRSEEPYSARDRQMIESVVSQMGIRYENLQLKDRAARDRRVRVEVLGRMDSEGVNLVKECPACGACFDSKASFCHDDGSELTLSLPVERTIEGKYRLDRLIGRGGMGAVYEGMDLRLSRSVAIKILTGRMFGDRAALRRFEREAQASARLNHPNVTTVYDYGLIGGEGAFLVMERLHGKTLKSEILHYGAIPPYTAAQWFDQIFEGVKAAHVAGVVHRDLKPENVIIVSGSDGDVLIKILDFGLAKIHFDGTDPNSLTVPGTVMGTFGYMSPEQLAGLEVDARSDIFSLGVMVTEALTGQKPFTGRTLAELAASMSTRTVSLGGEGHEIRELERILQRCVAHNPGGRFQTIGGLQDALIPAILKCHAITAGAVVGSDLEPTRHYGETEPA